MQATTRCRPLVGYRRCQCLGAARWPVALCLRRIAGTNLLTSLSGRRRRNGFAQARTHEFQQPFAGAHGDLVQR